MTGRNVLIVGAGLRVQRDVLPVLRTLGDRFTLAGLREEETKTITSEGVAHETAPLDDLDAVLEAVDIPVQAVGGLSIEQAADVLGVGTATIEREWRLAKAVLHSELNDA